MPAQKFPVQVFEEFRGLDLLSSPLTRKLNNSLRATNMKYANQRALTGRRGFRQHGQSARFSGLSTYSYADPDTGGTQQELLAVNDSLWRLRTGTLRISRTGTDPCGLTFEVITDPDDSDYGKTRIAFIANVSGTPTVVYETFLSDTMRTIGDFATAIDAVSGISITDAGKRGNITGPSVAPVTEKIEVSTATSNYVVGDFVTFQSEGWGNNWTDLTYRKVLTVTPDGFGTTTLALESIHRSVLDSPVAGVPGKGWAGAWGAPLTGLKYNEALSDSSLYYDDGSGGTEVWIEYPYWEPVPFDVNLPFCTRPFPTHQEASGVDADGEPLNTNFQIACFQPGDNSIFITGYDDTPDEPGYYEGRLWKYDGTNVYRAGMPPMWGALSSSLGAGSLTGTYKYMARYVFRDRWGIDVYGRPSHDFNELRVTPSAQNVTLTIPCMRFNSRTEDKATSSSNMGAASVDIPVSAGHKFKVGDIVALYDRATSKYRVDTVSGTLATQITFSNAYQLSLNDVLYKNPFVGFKQGGARANGAQASVTAITVDAGHDIQIGDTVYFYDSLRSVYTEREVTLRTDTTITLDGEAVSVADNAIFSKNLRIEIYRTKNAGDTYYHVATIPHSHDDLALTYTDSTADTALGAIFEAQEIGREFDLPPKGKLCTIHQGLMVMAAHPRSPNTVSKSLSEGLEYFPEASAGFDVPASAQGPITAIASDSEDRLCVFKANAFYDCVGDLDVAVPVTRAVAEGDYGIESQASLQRISGALVGLGRMGFIAVQGGTIVDKSFGDASIGRMVRPNVLRQGFDQAAFSRAIAVNDYPDRGYLVSMPFSRYPLSASTPRLASELDTLFFDYEKGTWFDWTLPRQDFSNEQLKLMGGASVFDRDLYLGLWDLNVVQTNWDSDAQGGVYKRCEDLPATTGNVSANHLYVDTLFTRAVPGSDDSTTNEEIDIVNVEIPYELVLSGLDGGMPSFTRELQKMILYSLPECEEFVTGCDYNVVVYPGRLLPQKFANWPVLSAETKAIFGGGDGVSDVDSADCNDTELVFDITREQEKAVTIGIYVNGSAVASGYSPTVGFHAPHITGVEFIVAGSSRNDDRRD